MAERTIGQDMVANTRFEDFAPRLRPGRIVPLEDNIIYETMEPVDQITLPLRVADFVILCDGSRTIREIIKEIYNRDGSIHFKSIVNCLYQLRKRGFLENGDELLIHPRFQRVSSTLNSFFKPLVQLFIAKRVINDHVSPWGFYLFSMLMSIGGLSFCLTQVSLDLLSPAFNINGSYFTGIAFSVVAVSALLSFKGLVKASLLLMLTGRLYNVRIVFSGVFLFFKADNESISVVSNRLFITLFHFAAVSSYWVVAWLGLNLLEPSSGQQLLFLAMLLTFVELDPFRESEINSYFRFLHREAGATRLASYLYEKSFFSLINPQESSKDQSLFVIFSHLTIGWLVAALVFFGYFIKENFNLLVESIATSTIFSQVGAGLVAAAILLVGAFLIRDLYELIAVKLLLPMKRHYQAWSRARHARNFDHMTSNQLVDELEELPLFGYFNRSVLGKIVAASRLKVYPPGTRIIVEGDTGRAMFVLLSGALQVRKWQPGFVKKIGEIHPTSIFGEVAVLEESPRTAEVIATKPSVVLAVPGSAVRKAAQESQSIREMRDFTNAIMVNQFFTSAPMFRDLPEELVHQFTVKGKLESYKPSEIVFKQGQPGDGFYLVIRGSVSVEMNQLPVNQVKQGGFFGEIAVIADIPRTATIRTTEATLLLKIGTEAFWELISQNIEMAMFIEAVGETRIQMDVPASPPLETVAASY